MTEDEELEAIASFEAAITSSLGDDLPQGASVVVTGIKNGEVKYIIVMNVGSSDAADAAVNSIETSLADQAMLNGIAFLVQSVSSSSTSAALADALSSTTISSNSPGTTTTKTATGNALSGARVGSNSRGTATETSFARVTSSGSMTTNLSGLTSAEVEEASSFLESAIAATLQAEGVLPSRSTVSVTGISNGGVASYEIVLRLAAGGDNAVFVNEINDSLALASTLAAISSSGAADAATGSSSISALLYLQVTGVTAGETKGV